MCSGMFGDWGMVFWVLLLYREDLCCRASQRYILNRIGGILELSLIIEQVYIDKMVSHSECLFVDGCFACLWASDLFWKNIDST